MKIKLLNIQIIINIEVLDIFVCKRQVFSYSRRSVTQYQVSLSSIRPSKCKLVYHR